ncbi:uncharacterized protein LOC142563468 [Dermacentor variabilis]|uniref:uncharacterized protein LOC142563468 n=1 Tax=Dermacentor variabilis TaxID=34621 RepID=UPI003F5B29F3
METAGDCFVPGGFFSVTNGWKKRFGNVKIPTEAQLEKHMVSSGALFARQQMKGTMFQEGYVRNVMYNDVSAESTCGLLRSICLPSMKGGYYIVHAAISKASGSILAGHCLCPAGLSGTCQHFVGLILHAIHLAQKDAATCTEVPCAWIVPAQVKKHEPPLPLQDITFHTRKHEGAKRRRFDPLPGLSPMVTAEGFLGVGPFCVSNVFGEGGEEVGEEEAALPVPLTCVPCFTALAQALASPRGGDVDSFPVSPCGGGCVGGRLPAPPVELLGAGFSVLLSSRLGDSPGRPRWRLLFLAAIFLFVPPFGAAILGLSRDSSRKSTEPTHHTSYAVARKQRPHPSLLAADLEKVAANCLLLRYMSKENSGESLDEHSPSEVAPEASDTPLVPDIEDIHSETCQRLIQERFDAIQALSVDSRAVVLESTIGQAANPTWHMERIGRLTASMFKRIVRCRKPDSIVKEILYPRSYKTEAMHYGNVHEPDAVQAYEELMACMDKTITVGYTGPHVHAEHPFIAASPDRLVFEGSDMGLLEVKCPFSFKGKSIEEAAASPKFCCRETDNEITFIHANSQQLWQNEKK